LSYLIKVSVHQMQTHQCPSAKHGPFHVPRCLLKSYFH